MKEVRFNDKMWFGKHKGARISDLINGDPNYIQKLVKEGKIKLDAKSNKYFEDKFGISEKKNPPRGGFGEPLRAPRAERFGNGGDLIEASTMSIYNHIAFKHLIHALTTDILRGEFGVDVTNLLAGTLYEKIALSLGEHPGLLRDGEQIRLVMNRYSNDRELQNVRLTIYNRWSNDEIIQVQFRH